MKKNSSVYKFVLVLVLFFITLITVSLYGAKVSIHQSLAASQNNLLAQAFPSNTVCGGSQYCVPSVSPIIQPSSNPSTGPSLPIASISAEASPGLSQSPCTPVNYQSRARPHHHHHKHGGSGGNGAISSLIQQLLDFIMQLLNQLIALLGGSPLPSPTPSSTPNVPGPSGSVPVPSSTVPNPCPPSAAPLQPSAAPSTNFQPSSNPLVSNSPSSAPMTSVFPSVSPSGSMPAGMRAVPDPLYGVTVDDISNITNIVDSSKALAHMPTTRIVFDTGVDASNYTTAVNTIQPVSYIMGEILDSEGLANTSLQQYHDRVASYLQTLGDKVDIWEVGNEVNGNWTGSYTDVGAKINDAYTLVKAAGKRSELTLWYDDGCGNGSSELDPIAFSQTYVPVAMRTGLDYVTVSYYESQCGNIRPTAATLTTFFNQLHQLYPNAKLGFGEIGFPNAVGSDLAAAQSLLSYYYGLKINVPGYIGGYFWWYYYEDMLPYTSKPLWQTLNTAIQSY